MNHTGEENVTTDALMSEAHTENGDQETPTQQRQVKQRALPIDCLVSMSTSCESKHSVITGRLVVLLSSVISY